MSQVDRKALTREYKETLRPAGIFSVRNTVPAVISGRLMIACSDESCPKCGAILYYRECPACEDGLADSFDDPRFEEYETCEECNGSGRFIWCKKCGWRNQETQV
ncbi:MAG: hypothetical protein GX571_06335 [Lentisphaerae bacterium]|jgi:hypothetical protein|nr:hypothetical protein [Lentisphaerota bacterium]